MITDRLEQVLRVWELNCISSKISIKRVSMLKHGAADDMMVGPVKHSESFRGDVLARKPFDPDKYIDRNISAEAMGVFSYLPASLHAWATASRRIYRLESDIQQLILQTNVSELTWRDVKFPFEVFGIALATPIREPGGQLFDFLLVHRGFVHAIDREGIMIWTISEEFEKPMPMTIRQAQKAYESLVTHGNFKKAAEVTEDLLSSGVMKTAMGAKLNCFIADGVFFDKPLKDTFSYIRENEGKVIPNGLLPLHSLPISSMGIEVERLVAGLCVYLDSHQNCSDEVRPRTDWKPVEKPTIDTTCITKEALVCSVQNVYYLSDLERRLLLMTDTVERDKICKELGVHYREGHARRRPGFGNDPEAPKCVHIPPVIVGIRRLAPRSLPRGTEKVL